MKCGNEGTLSNEGLIPRGKAGNFKHQTNIVNIKKKNQQWKQKDNF